MTNKKFKNVDSTETRYADYCKLYGEETVSALADEETIEGAVTTISMFEKAVKAQTGLIALFYTGNQLLYSVLPTENSYAFLNSCEEGGSYIVIPVYDCRKFDKDSMYIEDVIHAVINAFLAKKRALKFLQSDCLVVDECC